MLQSKIPAALLLGVLACASPPSPAGALDPVIVTAARAAQTADETLVPVTVISRTDIERSQAQSFADLLRSATGISMANDGGPGKNTDLYLRGANNDHVLVLVDGVRIGSATTGTSPFQDLPLDLIDHIEIVRGPMSSLYGSEAIGGVIQIFTKGRSDKTEASLMVGGGSYGTSEGSATLNGPLGHAAWYSLGLSGYDTAGFAACVPNATAGCYTTQVSADGYHNHSLRTRLGGELGAGQALELEWLHTDGTVHFDGSFQNQAWDRQDVLALSLNSQWREGVHTTLRLAQDTDRSNNYLDNVFQDSFDTRRNQVSLQGTLDLAANQQLVSGIDWLQEHVVSEVAYQLTTRSNTGVFVQYLGQFGPQQVQLSLRNDSIQGLPANTTGTAAWGWTFSPHLRLSASFGSAFKAPNFNDLFYPGYSNPGLQPEHSRSANLGLIGSDSGPLQSWSLNVYQTRIRDLIALNGAYIPVNIDEARIQGLELSGLMRLASIDLRGNLDLLDPRNASGDANQGLLLPRRARSSFALSADHSRGAFSLGATLRGQDRRFDDLANTEALGGYVTLDLHAAWRLDPAWTARLRVDNLFDRSYETAYLYNQAGRGFYVQLQYHPLAD